MGSQLLDNLQALLLGSSNELRLLVGGIEGHLGPGLLVVCVLGLSMSQLSSLCVTIGFAMVLLGTSPANLATILMFSMVSGLDAGLDDNHVIFGTLSPSVFVCMLFFAPLVINLSSNWDNAVMVRLNPGVSDHPCWWVPFFSVVTFVQSTLLLPHLPAGCVLV